MGGRVDIDKLVADVRKFVVNGGMEVVEGELGRHAFPMDKHAVLAALDALVVVVREGQERIQAAERERDELGPLFIRDACRVFGIDEDDYLRMDKLMAALVEGQERERKLREALDYIAVVNDVIEPNMDYRGFRRTVAIMRQKAWDALAVASSGGDKQDG